MAKNKNFEVGYGRPPAHSRFKPGKSGNPRGRSKGSRNVRTVLEAALLAKTTIREGGREVHATNIEIFIKKLLSSTTKDNMRAAKVLGEIIVRHVGMLPPASNDNSGRSADEDVVAADDEEIIERALSRLGSDKGGSDE